MLEIGPLLIDFTPLLEAAARSPLHAGWFIFANGGWLVVVITFLIGFKWMWRLHLARKTVGTWKWVLLAIDIPAENIQSPRAVENILAHLAGAHNTPDLIEKWITGFAQEWFSLEIVSIGGRVRFYIYTPVHLRDLVQSAVYAQYPTAEINEAEDYTQGTPNHFPDPVYNLWGTEFIFTKHQAYPLRTYEEFHDETAEEAAFKDPMAALLETMSSMLPGEQLWFQVTVTPIEHRSWQEQSYRIVEKLAGIPSKHKPSWLERILSVPGHLGAMIIDAFLPGDPEHTARIKEEMPSKMLYLTPGEREVIEAIEKKAAKFGFNTKIRVVCLSPKNLISKARGRFGVIGAMKQFTTEDMNALKPELKKVGTHAHYFFTDWRKNWKRRKIMAAYKRRSNWRGMLAYVMNVEELATIWHFPVAEAVKTPLLKKSESKRGEPPHELPMEGGLHGHRLVRPGAHHSAPPKGLPEEGVPENLPVG